MSSTWSTASLRSVAPKNDAPMPPDAAKVWNLSLEDIEPITGRILNRVECFVAELGSTKCAFDQRHVLYSKLRPYLNKVVVPDEPGVGTSELLPLLPDPDRLDREFLAFFLRSPDFVETVSARARGANLPRVSMDEFWACAVPLPPLDEQHRIVERIKACMARIDEIEGLRSETKKMAATLELAAFHDALVAGIEQHGWPMGTLGEVALSFRYGTSAKAHSDEIGTPVLRMGNIVNGYFDYSNLKYIELQERELDKYRLKMGDILINRTNSLELVGKAAMFDREDGEWAYASYLVCVDVDRSRVMPEFATAVINSRMGRDFVAATARRAIGMVNINAKEMARFPMPLPPLKDQEAIVELLRTVRSSAKNLRSDLEEPGVGHLRSAVLRKAFAGEL